MLISEDPHSFVSIERLSADQIEKQTSFFTKGSSINQILNAIHLQIIIVNQQRQIVFANKAFQNLLGMASAYPVIGKRPGEALGCLRATETNSGCGSTESCRHCNALNLILKSVSKQTVNSGEVIFRVEKDGLNLPLNLLENVVPIWVEGQNFYMVELTDITGSQRKQNLERVFFHDIFNTSSALKGLVSLLKDEVPDQYKAEIAFLEEALTGLFEEIMGQRQLLEAENNELKTKFTLIDSKEMIDAIIRLYQNHAAARGKLLISRIEEPVVFRSDLAILKRVLENMIKNALEATETGGEISLDCKVVQLQTNQAEQGEYIEFWIHNQGYIPESIQSQIFTRSFSTKGNGRGVGTYSMKLLGEKYLGGQVFFTTDEKDGTTFGIRLRKEN